MKTNEMKLILMNSYCKFLIPARLDGLQADSSFYNGIGARSNDYQFRAEFPDEIISLLQIIPPALVSGIRWNTERTGDTECSISIRCLTIDELRKYMGSVVDGHIMAQTVATPEDYTGERDWSA